MLLRRGTVEPREKKKCHCGNLAVSKGLCKAHYSNKFYHEMQGRGFKADHFNTKKQVTYNGLLARIRTERGSAKAFDCVGCGKPAKQWSLDTTENLLYENGRAFSMDVSKYVPRCQACLVRSDYKNGFRKKVAQVRAV